jgi:phage terminase large subunit-like protein
VIDSWDFNYKASSRGSSKMLKSAEAVHEFAKHKNYCIALVGNTIAHVVETMVEGPSGLLATAKPDNPVVYSQSKRRLEWPETGTRAFILSYDEPGRAWGLRLQGIWTHEPEA